MWLILKSGNRVCKFLPYQTSIFRIYDPIYGRKFSFLTFKEPPNYLNIQNFSLGCIYFILLPTYCTSLSRLFRKVSNYFLGNFDIPLTQQYQLLVGTCSPRYNCYGHFALFRIFNFFYWHFWSIGHCEFWSLDKSLVDENTNSFIIVWFF